jgi:hypothetical protein
MTVSMLERWYESQCNGEWEHSYGIDIDTLDNPGWTIKIDLRETRKQGAVLEKQKISRGENDWILYWIEEQKFCIACGPLNFSEATEIFVRWFNADSTWV